MATLAQLIVKVGADISELQKGLDVAKSRLERVAGSFEAAVKPSEALLKTVAGLGVGFAGAAAAGIKMAAEMEQQRMAFKTLLGSAKEADRFVKQLWDFAAKTPFEFPGLVDASRRLMAFGFTAHNVIPMMTAIGNAASAMGLGAEGIDRMTLALGQMFAKQKVQAQEMLQLTEAGVNAWQYLADAIGVSVPEAMKRAEKGQIDAATAIKAILEGMSRDFKGMMDEQSRTLLGLWSTAKDNVSGVLMTLGKQIVETFDLKTKLSSAIEWLSKLNEMLSDKGLRGTLRELIPPEIQARIVGIAGAISGALMPAILALVGNFLKATWALRGWMLIGTLVAEAAWYLYRNWDRVTTWFANTWASLKVWVVRQVDGMLSAIQRLVGWIPGVQARIDTARASLQRYAATEEAAITSRKMAAAMAQAQAERHDKLNKAVQDSARAAQAAALSFGGTSAAATGGGGRSLSDALSAVDNRLEILRAKWDLWAEQNRRLEGSNEFLRAKLQSLKDQAAALEEAIAAVSVMKGKDADETHRLTMKHLELQQTLAKTRNEIDSLTESLKAQAAIPWRLPGTGQVIDIATKAGGAIYTALTGNRIVTDPAEQAKAIRERLSRWGWAESKINEYIKQNVPGMATGGIVTRPTLALIGERGPEAVVPLRDRGRLGDVNVTVNITGNQIASDLDLRRLAAMAADEVARRVRSERLAMAY